MGFNFDASTVSTIAVILVLIILLGFVIYRKFSGEKGEEELKKFLESLANQFEEIILKHLSEIDFSSIDNIAEAEKKILDDVVNELWNMAIEELSLYTTDKFTYTLIKKVLTRENVETFAKTIFESNTKIQTTYTSKYNDAVIDAINNAEQLEQDTAQQNKELETGNLSNFTIPENAEFENLPEQEIIPQHEDEIEEVNPDEDAVDVVDENN